MMFRYNRMANGKCFLCLPYKNVLSNLFSLLLFLNNNNLWNNFLSSFLFFSESCFFPQNVYAFGSDGKHRMCSIRKISKIHFALVRTYSDASRISSTYELHSTKGKETTTITIEKKNSPTDEKKKNWKIARWSDSFFGIAHNVVAEHFWNWCVDMNGMFYVICSIHIREMCGMYRVDLWKIVWQSNILFLFSVPE